MKSKLLQHSTFFFAAVLIILVVSISTIIPSSYAVQDLQKIECVDDNLNINGIDLNQLTQQQQDQIKRLAGIDYEDADTQNSNYNDNDYGLSDDSFSVDNNLINVCINANLNDQITVPPEEPQEPVGDNVYVVWPDNTDKPFGRSEVWFAFSKDKAESFSDSKNISQTAEGSNLPQISAKGNDVYVVWQDNTPDTNNYEIFFRASHDGGETFGDIENLSNTPGFSSKPQISSSGDDVYVVWQEGFPVNDIFVNVSHDRGETFKDEADNLSENTGNSGETPQISSSGANVYVVWQDGNDIFVNVSHDRGETFKDEADNLTINIGDSAETPQISSSGANVYVVWQDNDPPDIINDFEIFFRASHDGGETFGDIENLSNTPLVSSFGEQISSSGNNVYIVWADGVFPNIDIFFRASHDGGETFGDIENLSNTLGFSTTPQVSSFGNEVYVVWADQPSDIFFNVSHDGGETFKVKADNLSNNPEGSSQPQISSAGNNIYIAWVNFNPTGSPPNSDDFFRASHDGGETFGDIENLSNNPGNSFDPQIATSID